MHVHIFYYFSIYWPDTSLCVDVFLTIYMFTLKWFLVKVPIRTPHGKLIGLYVGLLTVVVAFLVDIHLLLTTISFIR